MQKITNNNELSFTDKIAGIFTEPDKTFKAVSVFPPKTSDWTIPLIISMLLGILSLSIMMSNPQIRASIVDKQMNKMEQEMNQSVKDGKISKEQAQTQVSNIRDKMDNYGTAMMLMQGIGISVSMFLLFLLLGGYFFLCSKFLLKGEGTYAGALQAYGLSYAPLILSQLGIIILTLTTNKAYTSLSLASIFGIQSQDFFGWIASKADIFSLWFYLYLSLALSRIFKSPTKGKYFAMVFGSWLGFSLLLFLLGYISPFFKQVAF